MQQRLIALLAGLVLLCSQALPALAAAPERPTLSLQQALQQALANSPAVSNTAMELEKADITRDDLQWNLNGVKYGYNIPEETERSVYKAYFSADLNYRLTEKKLENEKRQLKIDVHKAYNDVLLAEQQLAVAKQNLGVVLQRHSHAYARYQVGMATQADILKADADLTAAQATLEEKTNNLTKAYSTLNKLLGRPQDDRPLLTDPISFQSAGQLDVDTTVLKAVNNSYEVWSTAEAAKTYQYLKYYEKYYDIGDYNEAQAKNTAQDTREAIRLQAKQLCLAVLNLEQQYKSLAEKEKQAAEGLRVYQTLYQVGMKTKDEVDEISLNLAQVQQAKTEVAAAHTNLLETLQRLTGELSSKI
ncbi:hypothetical protein JCM39194_22180 [Desulfotomaculum varum]